MSSPVVVVVVVILYCYYGERLAAAFVCHYHNIYFTAKRTGEFILIDLFKTVNFDCVLVKRFTQYVSSTRHDKDPRSNANALGTVLFSNVNVRVNNAFSSRM